MRRKISLVIFIICCFNHSLFAQSNFPSYIDVVKEFYSKYSFHSNSYQDGISFARMKDGWFVDRVDRVSVTVNERQLFWSKITGEFVKLEGYDHPSSEFDIQLKIDETLSGHNNDYNLYGYDRCMYFGYPEWARDMISEYGRRRETLSDTLLEGLARAYSFHSNKFLWYQMGGNADVSDTLTISLKPLQHPSKERIDKFRYHADNAIELYQTIANRNNNYETIVGNASMKVFNEIMHAYMQMSFAGYVTLAKDYLDKIKPDKTLNAIAKNYLGSCPPNAILFTYGDNDTYPLWYVQEKENFRKDVTVINTSLLGLPIYIDWLKNKGVVNFSIPASIYGEEKFQYISYTAKDEWPEEKEMDLAEFIDVIRSKTYPDPDGFSFSTYPSKAIIISVKPQNFANIVSAEDFSSTIKISLNSYIFSNSFLILDIINSNISKRPIYFTSEEELFSRNYLQREGLVFRFLPIKENAENIAPSVKKTEDFLSGIYIPLSSLNSQQGIRVMEDGDAYTYGLYAFVIGNTKDRKKLDEYIKKFNQLYPKTIPFTFNSFYLGEALLKAGDISTAKRIMEQYVQGVYKHYSDRRGDQVYISKTQALNLVKNVGRLLEERNIQSEKVNSIQRVLEK